MASPLKTFIIYARDDKEHKNLLLRHLSPLVSNGYLNVWHDGDILPGEVWEKQIKTNLNTSQLVLVLVSVNCLNSDFIETKELETAIGQLRDGHTRIVPIIVSPCGWRYHKLFKDLQGLPEGMKPVSEWHNVHSAWTNVIDSLAAMVKDIRAEQTETLRKQHEADENKRLAALGAEREHTERETAEQNRRKEAEKQRRADEAARQAEAKRLRREQGAEQKRLGDLASRLADLHKRSTNWSTDLPKNAYKHHESILTRFRKFFIVFLDNWRIRKYREPIFKHETITCLLYALLFIMIVWSVLTGLWKTCKNAGSEPLTDTQLSENMIFVQGGTFTMGCKDGRDKDCLESQKPAHSVTLSDFYIGKYEVTQAEWKKVIGSNPSNFKNCDNCPVEHVSWDDLQEFLKRINAQNPGKTYRLPAEAEWEYAARGGNQSKGYAYSGSNTLSDVGWYDDNSNSKTHPVGGLRANELGIFDMSGNIWEWCADDWHGDYKSAPSNGRAWVDIPRDSSRVLRGGSWLRDAQRCRTTYRRTREPDARDATFGFRLALSL